MKTKIALLSLLFLIIAFTCCNRIIPERLITQIDTTSWIMESFKVSPDSQHLAYVAGIGEKWLVVMDGEEGKQYDGIGAGTLIFSPNSQHLAYAARIGEKRFVVADGQEGKQYDGIINLYGARIVFDSPDRLHYLAVNYANNKMNIYLVQEKI